MSEEASGGRVCGRCGEVKPLKAFAWRRRAKGQRDNYCRPCRSAYGREHYLANRTRYIREAKRRKQAQLDQRFRFLRDFFKEHPCSDCGERDPCVLEFDHLGDKSFMVSQGVRDRNWQSVLDEIAKCEVVCANCHRRRTAFRRESRAVVAQR